MATTGVFRQTADVRAGQYMGTQARDKGRGEPGSKEQLERYYGRSEHQPFVNPYHGRPVIDQTLGDQFGEPRYELDVGLQVKNIIMADAEQPWMTIIMPLQNTDALTITGTEWYYNRRLPRPTPYHAPSPYVTEEYRKFYGQVQRYGESIRMESDFYHTEAGMQNFILKLTGIASDMIEGIRFDVLREMIRAIEEFKRYYAVHTYTENPSKDIMSRVALFAALNKAPTKENQLGVTIERLERALHDVVPGPYEVIVPPEWGIFIHMINQTPAPQPYVIMSDVFVENGPSPKGIIGRNRYWEYPDVVVETGAPRLRLLDRKTIVAEYYRNQFKDRGSDLCVKLTGLLASDKDPDRMRNIVVYSADENKYIEVHLEDMVRASCVVPDYYKTGSVGDRRGHGSKYRQLKDMYNEMGYKGSDAKKYFHPSGDVPGGLYGKRGDHHGISGSIRRAPLFLQFEPKEIAKSHIRKVKYSGESDGNVQDVKDHMNQGQVLCARAMRSFVTGLGATYSNGMSLLEELANAPINDAWVAAFVSENIHNSLNFNDDGGLEFPTNVDVDNALIERWGDFKSFRMGKQLATESGGHYILPTIDTGLKLPPGCDCAVGLYSIKALTNETAYNNETLQKIKDHIDVMLTMVKACNMLPECELTNPANRNPWVRTDDPVLGAFDFAYNNGFRQFHPPMFVGVPTRITEVNDEGLPGENVEVLSGDDQESEGIFDTENEDDTDVLEFSAAGIPKGSVTILGLGEDVNVMYVRTSLAFTPGIRASLSKKTTTGVREGNKETQYKTALDVPGSTSTMSFPAPEEEITYEELRADPEIFSKIRYNVEGDISELSRSRSELTPMVSGKPKEFHHYSYNMIYGATSGMSRSGELPRASIGSSSSSSSTRRSSSTTRRRRGVGSLIGSSTSRRGRRREIPSLSDAIDEEVASIGAEEGEDYEPTRPGPTSRVGRLGNEKSKVRLPGGALRYREGYRMMNRFNGSNFVRKMKKISAKNGDPSAFFAIACMMSRQDRVEDLIKLVENGLHVAFDFLLFRLVELHMESAILCKAGLGVTVVNNSDYKNAETVSTKTYHGHLTVHYGAKVTKRDWQLMLEDLRCNGYIQGKGSGFIMNPGDLLRSSRSTGSRNKSFICYAQPIASPELPPMLSMSGQWEMPDVVPQNLPESGRLYHGCDWYNKLWGWHDTMVREREKQTYFRTKGNVWPQVAFRGWHQVYSLNNGRFQIESYGEGHLAGSDYPGAIHVLNGDSSWFNPPPMTDIEMI